jgi:hypothetical protein
MLKRLALALSCGLLAVAPAPAVEGQTAFDCTFGAGTTRVYDSAGFKQEPAKSLTFGIAGIDTKAQSAELKTGSGSGTLRLVLAVNATHFLEVATEGALNITTIYEKDEAKGAYPAVHSRHFALLGQPIVTQYQGFCRSKS